MTICRDGKDIVLTEAEMWQVSHEMEQRSHKETAAVYYKNFTGDKPTEQAIEAIVAFFTDRRSMLVPEADVWKRAVCAYLDTHS